MIIGQAGMTLSPAKFSSLDWTDFKDEYGIIAGGKYYCQNKCIKAYN